MFAGFEANPGRLYVVATLLPLGAFALLLVGGGVRAMCRPFRMTYRVVTADGQTLMGLKIKEDAKEVLLREANGRDTRIDKENIESIAPKGGFAGSLYWICGGDKPLKTGAYLATACMVVSAILAVTGLVWFLSESGHGGASPHWAERTDWVRIGPPDSVTPAEWEKQRTTDPARPAPALAMALEIGYKIDSLTAVIFAMVAVISTLIFIFSLGYMRDETEEKVEDHEVDRQAGEAKTFLPHGHDENSHEPDAPAFAPIQPHHFTRHGRFGRFFLYLSLFCFSMFNLVIADNLFQVFVSWELVGVCSFLLIGFYYERPSASKAANKAFIVNRIGDAGFLVGILLAWTYLGTLNFEDMFHRVRAPELSNKSQDSHPHTLTRFQIRSDPKFVEVATHAEGPYVGLYPIVRENYGSLVIPGILNYKATLTSYGAMPYWLFVVMGIGIFMGCVGKSAQFPLHTWLPDAMEGPTPVSALIHAATMVAAGVYLVGRCYPLFAPEVLLVIAYTGAVTLFIAATIALVQTDIKRILAYSTCSQLGYMMLALGVGGWVAGLLHLITHAFFKALLFLGSGSVILGCHHEQDVRKMGGLRKKMPITAFTMLVGVLAICGTPFFSGWYSKDQVLAAAATFGFAHPGHILLFALPLLTAGLTAFYMFRLWFLTFAGQPRDEHVDNHAHESPAVMTVPLIVLALFSIGVAWGWPIWDAESSALGHVLEKSKPASLEVGAPPEGTADNHYQKLIHNLGHGISGWLALIVVAIGVGVAYRFFIMKPPLLDSLYARGNAVYRFLLGKWYFDEAYDAAFVNPTVSLAKGSAAVDKRPTDAPPPPGEAELPPQRYDFRTLDGILNAIGQSAMSAGRSLRRVQTGRLRTYVLALALTAVLLLAILVAF